MNLLCTFLGCGCVAFSTIWGSTNIYSTSAGVVCTEAPGQAWRQGEAGSDLKPGERVLPLRCDAYHRYIAATATVTHTKVATAKGHAWVHMQEINSAAFRFIAPSSCDGWGLCVRVRLCLQTLEPVAHGTACWRFMSAGIASCGNRPTGQPAICPCNEPVH